jgi:hypothetical protein
MFSKVILNIDGALVIYKTYCNPEIYSSTSIIV